MQMPLHAVETPSEHFIILHSHKQDVVGETAQSRQKWKETFTVSKVTRDGRLVVRRFVPQNETQELNHPCYLALDSDDRVFVADGENERVILLNSDLNWIRSICWTKDENDAEISMPHRLCYDKVEKQLIVAGNIDGEGVNIYSVDQK